MQWNLKSLKKKKIPYSPDPGPVSDTWLQRVVFTLSLSNSSLSSFLLSPFQYVSTPPHYRFNYAFTHALVPVWSSQQGLPDHLTQNCKTHPLAHHSLLPSLLYCSPKLPLLYDILYILPISSLTILPIRMIVPWDQDYLSILFCFPGIKKSNMPIKMWSMTGWCGENHSIVTKSVALESDSPRLE